MHDIGKIAIPDAVLLKPGKLDDKEWLVMRQHPTIGYQISPERPLRQALQHHESMMVQLQPI